MTTETPGGPVPPVEPTPVVAAPPATSAPPPPPAYAVPPAAPQYQQPYGYTPQPGQPYAQGYYPPAAVGPRGLSIASMVLGIVGVVFGIIYGLGLFPAIAAIITGHIAQKRQPAGRGFWIAGLICGYVGLLLSLIGIAIVIVVIVAISSNGGFSNIGTDSYNLGNN